MLLGSISVNWYTQFSLGPQAMSDLKKTPKVQATRLGLWSQTDCDPRTDKGLKVGVFLDLKVFALRAADCKFQLKVAYTAII
jgi:hypothetical protein